MPQAIRQENLYGAEDWSIVYSSFKNAEFKSYDFDTLRTAMVDYMRVNYPEEFNDYTQNSEFIALLDLVAYVGQNLAFRMDLNARENILDTAEKRESVLRIARMLSYKPKRVRPAQGFLKVTSVVTTDQVLDSTGTNLSNKVIQWGSDPSELDYERFIKVMNAAFNSNNKFGAPVKRTVNTDTANIFEIYQFNNTNLITNYPVGAIVDGLDLNFDLLPIDISTDGFITQTEPDYENSFTLLYRNDGRGVGSTKTGFFFLTKQGYINSTVEYISDPIANLTINLPRTESISEEDFFVQTVDQYGTVLKSWTRVSNLDFNNLVLNDQGGSNRDLYEVVYTNNDVTAIKFGDGTFTNIPTGYIRVWYRLAENDFIRVKAGEINNVTFDIRYANSDGQTQQLSLTLELQDNMITGLPAESLDEIKQNAPQAFYSKNRMVTGDDYNGLLPTLNSDVLALKAENRTFSGHSRNVDLRDPTGRNRPHVEFADDGYLYRDEYSRNFFVADDPNRRAVDFLDEFIENKLSDIGLLNFYYGKIDLEETGSNSLFSMVNLGTTQWYTTLAADTTSTATEITVASINVERSGTAAYDNFDVDGGILLIDNELIAYKGIQTANQYKFLELTRGILGTTAANHSGDARVVKVYDYRWQVAYNDTDSSNGYVFKYHYDKNNAYAQSIEPQKLGYTTLGPLRSMRPGSFVKLIDDTGEEFWTAVLDIKGDGLGIEDDNSNYTGLLATGQGPVEINKSITENLLIRSIIPALPRVFDDNTRSIILDKIQAEESFAVKFDNQSPKWTVIPETVNIDTDSDFDLSSDSTAWVIYVERVISGWNIAIRQLDYVFGSEELIRFYNINFAASFNPSFQSVSDDTITVIGLNSATGKLEDQQTYRVSGYYVYDDGYTDNSKVKVTPIDADNDFLPDDPLHFLNIVENNTIKLVNYSEGDFEYLVPNAAANSNDVVSEPRGVQDLPFRWTHTVPVDQSLNPSLTNIIDVYVLTKSYNSDYIIWKNRNDRRLLTPLPQTSEELRASFSNLLSYKMMTDEVIFHPVKFKPLFGTLAAPEFQAQFKVVKNPKSRLTDSEIKSKVIAAVDKFFEPGNFGFGEKFYFTELAAYVHTALSTDLSSVVIVPISAEGRFGTLFQVQPDRNEVVTSVASVNDVIVINEITDSNIRIGR
jgi:hypothetical protein